MLLLAIGLAGAGLGIAAADPLLGFVFAAAAVILFAVACVMLVLGELRTYRRSRHQRG